MAPPLCTGPVSGAVLDQEEDVRLDLFWIVLSQPFHSQSWTHTRVDPKHQVKASEFVAKTSRSHPKPGPLLQWG